MFKLYKILFFNSLIFGTLIAISSYSWMSMWIGLEINLLSIIPLMSDHKNFYPSESMLKYFITQALASSMLMFSIIVSLNLEEFFPQNSNIFMILMMNSAFLIKMGAAPFHSWFPEVMEGLSWITSLIMLTWQKIAPMSLLSYSSQMTFFFSLIIVFSSLISGVMGLNQISLRKIMAYSSINHIGWMLASLLNNQSIWMIYFFIYSLISMNIILIFKNLNIYWLKQLFISLNYNKMLKFFFILNFLSLGGLPPFLGFYPKWMVINSLTQNNFYFLTILLISFTLVTLYFYLRLTLSTLMINSSEMLIQKNMKNNFFIISSNFISLSGLLICTFIFSIF